MKLKILLLIWLFLVVISNVSAQEFSTETKNDFRVEWYLVEKGLTYDEWVIAIQNLDSSSRDFDLTFLMGDGNFDQRGISITGLFEWKNISFKRTIVQEINKTIFPEWNNLNTTSCNELGWGDFDSNNCETTITDYLISYEDATRLEWKKSKFNIVDKITEIYNDDDELIDTIHKSVDDYEKNSREVRAGYGLINIPKFNSKQKDATINGTKYFKLTYDKPIQSNNFFGSSFNLLLESEGETYHPFVLSGWESKRDIDITRNATKSNMQVFVNITLDQSKILTGNISKELRLTRRAENGSETEIGWTLIGNTSGSANITFTLQGLDYNYSYYYENESAEQALLYGTGGEFYCTSSTIALYHFNDNFNDACGNGFDATNIGTTLDDFCSGFFFNNTCVKFDNAADWVNMTTNPDNSLWDLGSAGSFSVVFYLQGDGGATGNANMNVRWHHVTTERSWLIGSDDIVNDPFRMLVSADGSGSTSSNGETLTATFTGRQIAAVFDNPNDVIKMFTNGEQQGADVAFTSNVKTTDKSPSIAGDDGSGGACNDCRMDEVWIVDVPLNESSLVPSGVNFVIGARQTPNEAPTIDATAITSTNATLNDTNQNISYTLEVSDADGDAVFNSTSNWYEDNESMIILNIPFNDGTANDVSGYGNDGTLQGGAVINLANGSYGKGLALDGDGDYIVVIASEELEKLNDSFTTTFWVRIQKTITGDNKGIVSNRGASGSFFAYTAFSNAEDLKIRIFDGTNNFQPTVSITEGQWTHYGIVIDGFTATGLKIYKDGVLDSNNDISAITSLIQSGGNNLMIGAQRQNGEEPLNGSIDEVQIWNISLSASQIWEIYQNNTHILTSDETETDKTYHTQVVVADGTVYSTFVNTTSLFVERSTVVTTPAFQELTINNLTDINVSTVVTILDSSNPNLDMILFINGVQAVNISISGVSDGENVSVLFNHLNYSHFDNLIVEAYLSDGVTDSIFKNSTEIPVINTPPTLPSILSPESNFTSINRSQTFIFSDASDLDNDTINFEFYLDFNDPLAPTIWMNSTTTVNQTDDLVNGVHYWRIRTNDGFNISNSNTTIRNFTIDLSELNTENSTFNGTVTEGSLQSFSTEIVYNEHFISGVSAVLVYNDTEFTATKTVDLNGTKNFSRSLTIPAATFDFINNFFWNFTLTLTNGTIISNNTGNYNQIVNYTNFTILDGIVTVPYLSFTFEDETSGTAINAAITSSTFIYAPQKNLIQNKTYTFSNSTENIDYNFSFRPSYEPITNQISLTYEAGNYPARIYEDILDLTNDTTIKKLFLLNVGNGSFVTFQVVNAATQPLEDVKLVVTRNSNTIESKFTDAAGAVTFFLDPDLAYTFTFTKSGFEDFATTLAPTQATYTITMASTTAVNATAFLEGVSWIIEPSNDTLKNVTTYNFSFTVISTFRTLELAGFILENGSGTFLNTTTCSVSGCSASILTNTANHSKINMDWFIVIDGNSLNGTKSWEILPIYVGTGAIVRFFDDLDKLGSGFNPFTKGLLAFILIFIFTGAVTWVSGLTSPIAILGIVFSATAFFDAANMLPTINGIPFLITVIMGLIWFGYFVFELGR